ncbi:methyltransferase domain-containing protein [Rhodoplanes serenus]|nr:methyltransferase domain-containing protein [Rhodoplanes serenus]
MAALLQRLDRMGQESSDLSAKLQAQLQSHADAIDALRDELNRKVAGVLERVDAALLPTQSPIDSPAPVTHPTANPDGWDSSQRYELVFWRDHWPYRHFPLQELQTMRHGDAVWFLKQMEFVQSSEKRFEGFEGSVLEAGSGPIGFFELMENVDVTAQDTLMELYAEHLPYSTLGKRGAATYTGTPVPQFEDRYRFVVCSNVLDHTADWIEFLRDCCVLLEPGGELLLITDSRGAPMEGHTQVFSPQQLRMVLRILGAQTFLVDRTEPVTDGHCDFRNYVRAVF